MSETTRERILAEFLRRVRAITIANGYVTNAGDQVFLGEEVQLGDDDPDVAIALIPDLDTVTSGGFLQISLPIAVEAVAKATLDAPWMAVEAVLGDLKRAIETTDRTLGGLLKGEMTRGSTRVVARPPGSTTVGASITYPCAYLEVWGAP